MNEERIRGILPVVQTAIAADGELDLSGMRRQVAFCVEAGAHGLVFPVLGSEFQFLSDAERRQLLEVVVDEASGRIPVIAGVAGPSVNVAVEHAAFARDVGAEAVIAMPPYIAVASPEQILDFYRAIAETAQRPVFIQHAPQGPGVDVPFLRRLLTELEHVRYIKEEMEPSAHNISGLVDADLPGCWGVIGGAWCRWMPSEMERGAHGFMPSVEVVDVHVKIWNTFHAGDKAGARAMFNRLAPVIHLTFCLGLAFVKEVLVRRGLLQTALMRQPGVPPFDAADHREVDVALAEIADLFETHKPKSEIGTD